jgi:DNA-binding response OmpR family regulator
MKSLILIIDDEAPVCESVALTLEMAGLAALGCDSFAAAGARLDEAALVLLDINMPEVSGIEALKRIRAQRPGLAVVMFTGVAELETAVRCMKLGAVDYLVKPVEPDALLACVLEHCPSLDRAQADAAPLTASELTALRERFAPARFRAQAAPEARALAAWLAAHYRRRECTLQQAARALETNTSYLSRLVSAHWGLAFRPLVNSLRLARLLELAGEPDGANHALDHLAAEVGWDNHSTFYSAVKQLTGLTPAQVAGRAHDHHRK